MNNNKLQEITRQMRKLGAPSDSGWIKADLDDTSVKEFMVAHHITLPKNVSGMAFTADQDYAYCVMRFNEPTDSGYALMSADMNYLRGKEAAIGMQLIGLFMALCANMHGGHDYNLAMQDPSRPMD